ncbi:hypothetical protein KC19_VG273800 [Ceratodon purpureus]|uniref:Uncharacterized protein n=1 Tax=Ceratodon purpureus TaxID=3225 RepID=A0A8T0HVQ2_CERPU|nr:hypothetical protein KC19_VG273800 [Ceratodon purpureus]
MFRSMLTQGRILVQQEVDEGYVGTNHNSTEPESSDSDIQIKVGDKVWLLDTLDKSVRVASGRVMSLGGQGTFHGRQIPLQYV